MSPSLDAAKIRCRSLRTSRFAWSQAISPQSQPGRSSSGPFTPAIAGASNLSFGSATVVIGCLRGLT